MELIKVSDELLGGVVPIAVYWLYSGYYMMFESLENYRLHSKEDEDVMNLVPKTSVVKWVLLQQAIQVACSTILFTVVGKDIVGDGDGDKGHSVVDIVRQLFIAMVVLDTWQYFMHRTLHENKLMYRYIHSHHHRLLVPYAFGTLYNHPLEGLLMDNVGGTVAFLVSGMSSRLAIFFFSLATMKGIDDHCGLWLPGNLFHVFFRHNTAYHDIHHNLYGAKYNFGQSFLIPWDQILGTYMPFTVEKRPTGGYQVIPTKLYKDE